MPENPGTVLLFCQIPQFSIRLFSHNLGNRCFPVSLNAEYSRSVFASHGHHTGKTPHAFYEKSEAGHLDLNFGQNHGLCAKVPATGAEDKCVEKISNSKSGEGYLPKLLS